MKIKVEFSVSFEWDYFKEEVIDLDTLEYDTRDDRGYLTRETLNFSEADGEKLTSMLQKKSSLEKSDIEDIFPSLDEALNELSWDFANDANIQNIKDLALDVETGDSVDEIAENTCWDEIYPEYKILAIVS